MSNNADDVRVEEQQPLITSVLTHDLRDIVTELNELLNPSVPYSLEQLTMAHSVIGAMKADIREVIKKLETYL